MAKLNVVIPAVEVTVGDVTYRKVDRKAQAGDIVKALKSEVDLTEGAFYGPLYSNGVGNLGFYDDVDDFRYSLLKNYASQFAVYAPVSEPATVTTSETITFEGAEWRKVDRAAREGDAIKFTEEDRSSYVTESELYLVDEVDSDGDVYFTDDDGDEIDTGDWDYEVYEKVAVDTPKYREVKRKANVGERIKIVNAQLTSGRYSNGHELVVDSVEANGLRANLPNSDSIVAVFHREYVVLEPVTAEPAKKAEPERLAVGDYARVVADHFRFENGAIVEITGVEKHEDAYRAKRESDPASAYVMGYKLVRATDEEVAAAKDPRSQFAIGDYVKVAVEYCEHNVGDVLKITNMGGVHDFAVTNVATNRCGFLYANKIVKLTAEEVAEIERKQAEEAKWNAIGRKVNEYKVGDIVEIVCKSDSFRGVGTVEDRSACGAVGVRMASVTHKHDANYRGAFPDKGDTITLVVPVEQRFDTKEVDAA